MSNPLHRLLTWLVGLSVVAVPAGRLLAQADARQPQPVLVLSVASSDRLLGDFGYLTQAAGAGDIGRLVVLMASPYTAGLQKDQPGGIYATLRDQEQLDAVGFFAVRDLQMLLRTLQDQLGTPRDAGDGVLELATDRPQSLFVREHNRWAFFANRKALLMNVPENPAEYLGDLPERYTLAARLHVAAIPAQLRTQAVQQMRRGFEEAMKGQRVDDPRTRLGELVYQSRMDSLITVIQESEQVTLGWRIDPSARSTHLDFALQAVADSGLARDLERLQNGTVSSFAGFLRPDAAAAILTAAPSTEADVQQALTVVRMLREEAIKGIQDDENLTTEEDRAQATRIVNELAELAQETIQAAKTDAGGCLILKPDSMAGAAGGFISDGPRLAAILRDIHDLAKRKDPRMPDVNFDAETHRDVTLHTTAIPLRRADQQARQLLGDPMPLVIGTGETSVYLAFGKDAGDLLKEVLDASAEQADEQVPPLQAYLALERVLEFAVSVDDNPLLPEMLAAVRRAPDDRVSLDVLPGERGATIRLSLDEGVLAVLGQGVRLLAPLMQNLMPQARAEIR